MSIIYVLIPIAIILTIIGIYLFFWAVKTEQFSDLEKEGLSILFDDEQAVSSEPKSNETTPQLNDKISVTKQNSEKTKTSE